MQGIRDIDEGPHGTVTGYVHLAGLTERLRENVHALFICRAFYISYALTQASLRPCSDRKQHKAEL